FGTGYTIVLADPNNVHAFLRSFLRLLLLLYFLGLRQDLCFGEMACRGPCVCALAVSDGGNVARLPACRRRVGLAACACRVGRWHVVSGAGERANAVLLCPCLIVYRGIALRSGTDRHGHGGAGRQWCSSRFA
ncbi:hypothetical protein C8R45DRAFT_989005, partial [Mycena sanguinolenta]